MVMRGKEVILMAEHENAVLVRRAHDAFVAVTLTV
jgi:hypothetical protein